MKEELSGTVNPVGVSTGGVIHVFQHKRFGIKSPSSASTHEATIIAGKTSKKCPVCKSARTRRFERSFPMSHEECESLRMNDLSRGKIFNYKEPRMFGKASLLNIWPIGLLLVPLPKSDYYFCWEMATCKKCGTTVQVEENSYYRQFCVARLFQFYLSDRISDICGLIKDFIVPNR